MKPISVGLFNDSFPPMIDGVAQTVKNYAENLSRTDGCRVTVVTPKYRGVSDHYPFEVVRYPSLSVGARIGYRVGVPFDPQTIRRLRAKRFDIMHIHSPFASSVLVSAINRRPRVPTVLTYHTRFDLDLKKRVPNPAMRAVSMKFLLENVKAVDEVWVVTRSSGRFLRDIGYEGRFHVMENGTDFARGKASPAAMASLRETYRLREDIPVFLFVGRMMWYKNLRLMLDTYALLRQQGMEFRALFVGEGYDLPAIQKYTDELGLGDWVTLVGPVHDRDYLRTFYSVADLFFFPSTYDTCGIVVKEAAACDCPSLLVRDSGAAEGAVHKSSGYLADESAADCARVIMNALSDRTALRLVGERASRDLYLTWEEAVERAYHRYEEILRRR